MNLDIVRELVRLMEESSLTALEVQDEGFRIRLENHAPASGSRAPRLTAALEEKASAALLPAAVEGEKVEEAPEESVAENSVPPGKQLLSPMVGTFHDLPEGKRVGVGRKLKKGDPICIIEAMKVMNEILMEEDGAISFVAVQDGDMVEYGQVLYVYS